MAKTKVFIELTPKNEQGTKRLSYHGTKWLLLRRTEKPYCGAPHTMHYCLVSIDGKGLLWVQKDNDPHFTVRGL